MRLKFNLGAVMTNGSDLSGGAWTSVTLTLAVTDWEGVYIGTGVVVGDSVWVDTGAFEPGTLTQYKITALGTRTASSVTVTAAFFATDHSVARSVLLHRRPGRHRTPRREGSAARPLAGHPADTRQVRVLFAQRQRRRPRPRPVCHRHHRHQWPGR